MVSSYIIKSTFCILFFINFCHSQEFIGFDDTILYKINWPGKDVSDQIMKEQDENTLNVKTATAESYKCFLPKQDEVNEESEPSYNGPNPLELLSQLSTDEYCSYKVDTYWIYEVCHSRHVRQYHYEREGIDVVEYYLGRWTIFDAFKLETELRRLASFNYPGPTKTRKVDGVNLPYFEMNLHDGTICDLSGRPRQTNVLYICNPQTKHNVFSVKETTICQYEVIVLTSVLCSHPWYKPPKSGELNIDCIPVGDSPRVPHNLKVLQSERSRIKKQIKMLADLFNKMENFIVPVSIDKNGKINIQVKVQPITNSELNLSKKDSLLVHSKSPTNEIEEYLSGDICLYGGSGWWKYEICYNKRIRQVHKEKGKPDEIVLLGEFNIEEHIKWLSRNEGKKLKVDALGKIQVISHFYSLGSYCQKTGEKRETEVRYKCVKGRRNDDSITLFLLEPKTCKYILTIESLSLCELINRPMDENGLFKIMTHSNINSEDSSPTKIQTEDKTEAKDKIAAKDKTAAEYKIKQQFEEVLKENNTVSVEKETELTDDKKKMGKIEL